MLDIISHQGNAHQNHHEIPLHTHEDGILETKVFFFNILFYLFLSALGLRCCARAFSSCSEQGLLFIAVHVLLIAVASLVAEHGL